MTRTKTDYDSALDDMNLLLEIERGIITTLILVREEAKTLKHANIADALDNLAATLDDEVLSGALFTAKTGPAETIAEYEGAEEAEHERQLRSDYLWDTRP